MFVQTIPEKRSGRVLLTFAESYVKDGKTRQRTVEKIGYLDEFSDTYDDPIAHFKLVARQRTAEQKAGRATVTLSYSAGETLPEGTDNIQNIGYLPFSQLYCELGIDRFMTNRQRNLKAKYNLNNIFRLLVFARLLFPSSKRKTFSLRDRFFEKTDFSLDDVYRSLGDFCKYADDLKSFLHRQVCAVYGRKTDVIYYDVTNYYFEIDEPDQNRKKGVCKEHRPNPIVQMGLLMDQQGLPVSYQLFPGNTNDCETLMPMLQEARRQFDVGRFVVVADRGLNTSNNTAMALAKGDGYVYGQSLLKASKQMQDYCLNQEGYHSYGNEQDAFRLKSRIVPRTIRIVNAQGQPVEVTVDEKQVFFYSDKYARKARQQRQEVLDKAGKLIQRPALLEKAKIHGAAKYIASIHYDDATGEVSAAKQILYLDQKKIEREARMDGYYAVVTSELDRKDTDVMDLYRGLWQIEESFRLTKSELETRPVHVSRWDHIQAHFLTCFVALLLLRLAQHRTGRQIPVGQLLDAMRNANGTLLQDSTYLFGYYTEPLKLLKDTFGIGFDRRFLTKKEILGYRKPS